MAWAKLDDNFHSHPKVLRAGLEATGLHARALAWCARYLTDGHIPFASAHALAGRRTGKLVHALVDAGLWEKNGDGWQIHDYLDYNPTREEVQTKRDWDSQRKSLFSDKSLVAAIRKRDQNSCRYCGHAVNWKDRKGPGGGTYDHVIPRGPNSLENVVVACRQCNSRKGARTPGEADMDLITVRSEPDAI